MKTLLEKLVHLNISVNVNGNELDIYDSDNLLTPELLAELSENKQNLLDLLKGVNTGYTYSAIPIAANKTSYKLSSAQRRLHFLFEFDKGSLAYNMPQALLLKGNLNKDRLQNAFKILIKRHESLRTSFGFLNEEPVQIINEITDFEIVTLQANNETALSAINAFIKPFSLDQAPLLRVGLAKLSTEEHLLIIDMHHIITDGVSEGVLIRDFVQLYREGSLPELRLQYKDYSEWQQSELQQKEIAKHKDFWTKLFADLPPIPEFPADYPRPVEKNYSGKECSFSLTRQESSKLRSIAETEDVTMFTVILSAFNLLLSKLSNQEDIVIGVPVAGRSHADLESIVGMFVNTLALRNFPKGNRTYSEFLASVKTAALACFDHQEFPFEALIDILQIERDPGRHPLFDVMFAYENFETAALEIPGLSIEPYANDNNTLAKFDLLLMASEAVDQIHFTFRYATGLFKENTIQRFVAWFKRILSIISDNVSIKLADIDILSDKERQELYRHLDYTNVDYPVNSTITSLFEEQAGMLPAKIAIELAGQQLTYRELNQRSNQLAWRLRHKGVGRNTLVGLLTNRSQETIIGMLAILKAGGAYMPIDVDYPAERKEYMISDSGLSLLVTTEPKTDYDHLGIKTIRFSDAETLTYSIDNPDNINEPEDLCYIIYTSGTTGKPKGTMIEHKNVVRLLFNAKFQFDFTANDIWTMFHSHCFDFSVWEMYGALLYGGKVVIIPKEVAQDPMLYRQLLLEKGVTILNQTPSAFYHLIQADHETEGDLKQLRYVILGGEALKPAELRRWKNRYPDCRLINMYGITETTVFVTYKEIGDYEIDNNISNIGKPIPTLCVYVLDKHLKLVPPGVVGELFVGGDGVGRGYLRRPELTSEKFIIDPYKPGQRLYRSGDLVRTMDSGDMEYLGRIDEQVKLRGFRIELGEIENKLTGHPLIDKAVVLLVGKPENKYLVAWYVSDQKLNAAELRTYLSAFLPDYMIPSGYVHITSLPLTTSGKIDRKALPDPELKNDDQYVAPSNAIEEELVTIWSDLLNLDPSSLSINSIFFELGGNSLKAVNLVNRIAKVFSVSVPLKELFNSPTIHGLSKYIRAAKGSNYVALQPAPASDHYTLSAAQKRLYFLYEVNKDSLVYNMPGVLRLEGSLDVGRLQGAFKQLLQRHESLRTTFELLDGEVVQRISPEVDFEISYVETTAEEADTLIQSYIQPFSLEQAPLLRVRLLRTAIQEHLLFTDMHHIISDGVSIAVLTRDFVALYHGESLPPLPLQYKDYATWQQSKSRLPQITHESAFWLDQFASLPEELAMPLDYERPMIPSGKGAALQFSLSPEDTRRLRSLAAKEGCTLFMVMLSAFNILLSRLSNQEDIVIGTTIAGRNHADLENIVGMFVNTLALRNFPKSDMRYRDFLTAVKNNTLACFEHQELPLEELVETLHIGRNLGRHPLVNVMLAFPNFETVALEIPGLIFHPYSGEGDGLAKFDLSLAVTESEEQMYLLFDYATDLFKEETVQKFFTYFQRIVSTILENEQVKLADIDILSEKERQELFQPLDNTQSEYPRNSTITSLFEKQAGTLPGNVAIELAGQQLTYRELNEKSNQLAWRLRQEGVSRNSIVGLLTGRSQETIIGMLAILKAGGAYLPIDVDYPADRKEYMITDSGISLLVTTESKVEYEHLGVRTLHFSDTQTLTYSIANPDNINHPDDLCYIIYTSGTTGKPKGTLIEHKNVVRLLFNDHFQFDFTALDVWTMFHSHCFDFSVWEMYGALLYGGKVIIIPKEVAQDPTLFRQLLREKAVTILNQTPSAFYNLIQADQEAKGELTQLRYVIFGGEALKPAKLHPWKNRYPDCRLINMFGITETTVHVTYKEIGNYEIENNISNIGKPIPTLCVYVLDKFLKPVPPGVVGELFVGGEGVGRGYLKRPELTSVRFITDPYKPGQRLYRSGDRARIMDNGDLEYLGRTDHQVKIRGFRIEPGEIENQLLQQPEIKDAIVIPTKDREGNMSLRAYLIVDEIVSTATIRYRLTTVLPDYMVPASFVLLDKFPLTSNGKVDKEKLPEPESDTEQDLSTPENETEEVLTGIWANVLNIQRPGTNSNFFSLGGDSMKAIKLIYTINKTLDAKIRIADLFLHPTIRELATRLKTIKLDSPSEKNTVDQEIRAEIERKKLLFLSSGTINNTDNIEDAYPASDIQTGMIFHGLLEPHIYHDQFVRLYRNPNMNTGVLDRALKLMIDKHPILRTAFYQWQNEMVQVVFKDASPCVEHYDLTQKNRSEQITFIQQYLSEDKEKPFLVNNTGTGFWRFITFALSGDTYCACFIFHHAILDGWSEASFTTELHNTFLSLLENPGFVPAPLKCTYKDFVVDQLITAIDPEIAAYWKNELSGYKRFAFGTGDDSDDFIQHTENLPRVLHEQLIDKSRQMNVSVKNICFAAYVYAVNMFSYENDITVGLVTNNRPLLEDGDKMLGCFLNTFPVRILIPGNVSWNEYVQLVGKKLDDLKKYDSISLARIIDLIQDQPAGKNPITDIKFNYTDFHVYNDLNPGELPEPGRAEDLSETEQTDNQFNMGYTQDNYLFSFNVDETGGSLTYSAAYSTAFANELQAKHFLIYFKKILEQIIQHAGQTMSKQSIFLPDEYYKVIHDWNKTGNEYPCDKTITALFEQQVKKTPDNTALVFEKEKISYRELNERANQLGRYLQSKGVKRESTVALMVDRRAELIIGVLGIFKAGGTYLPIDIYQPERRVKQILENSQAEFLLTTNNYKDTYAGYTTAINIEDVKIKRQSNRTFRRPVAANDTAYIIYTSGSTGTPKGVMVSHRSVINLVCAQRQTFAIDPTDRILQFSSISFDASVEQTWLALLTGATLVLVSREVIMDKLLFDKYISKQKVTHLHATPSFLEEVILNSPNDLRRIVAGGEVCKPELAEQFRMDYDFYNEYGPSENTVTSTMFGIKKDQPWNGQVSIGRPLSNTTAYILDKNMELLPEGIQGELYLGGDGMCKGYMKDEEMTKSKFMLNPYVAGEKIYRTGDLARWLPDGTIDYLGRIDEQVKLRGFRIELGEIENKLEGHPRVSKAVVQLVERSGNKYLAAWYVSEQELDAGDLRTYLAGYLPDYMIPSGYVHLDNIPLNTSGKINRKALPDAELKSNDQYIAPSNPIEEELVKIWSDLLSLEPSAISVNSSFFDLGGHSLKATNLAFRIKKELLTEIPLVDVFKSPTISKLAKRIKQRTAKPIKEPTAKPLEEPTVKSLEEPTVKPLEEPTIKSVKEDEGLTLLRGHNNEQDHLFFIHDISGDIQSYIELAALFTQYNCWGIRSSTFNYFGPADLSLKEIAAEYIEKIKTIQPGGSYNIAGWSFGGKIAYEIAHQLEHAGDKVNKLMLIDTDLATLLPYDHAAEKSLFSLTADKMLLSELLKINTSELENTDSMEELWKRAIVLMNGNQVVTDEIKALIPEDIRSFIPHIDNLSIEHLVMNVNTIRTLRAIGLQEVSGEVKTRWTYIKAGESNLDVKSLPGHLKNKITISEIIGDHFSILKKPHIFELIKALK